MRKKLSFFQLLLGTWLFKKLLRLRREATQWLQIKPGDGSSIRFWYSPWSPFGPLIKFVGANAPRLSGIPLSSTLASIWTGSSWTIAPARSVALEQIQIHMSTITLTDFTDLPTWNSKHKILSWLFVLNSCPTLDRLLSWGLHTDASCLLCNNYPESRNYIFFYCGFTFSIWVPLSSKLQLSLPSHSWDDTLNAISTISGSTQHQFLARIAWQAVIYETWRERNHRLHRGSFRSPDILLSLIERTITNRISSLREENPEESSICMQLWLS